MQLTEEKIRKIIKEELGIALEVSEISKTVYQQIIDDINLQQSEHTDICNITSGSIITNLDNLKIHINYCYRNFFNNEVLDDIDIDMLTDGGSVYISQSFISCNINLFGVSGTINQMEAMNTIQHEIEHLYQEIKSNKRIPSNDRLYAKMRTDLESGDENHKKIAKIIYLCFKSEQEGFVNGTYAWCMCQNFQTPPFSYKDILNSPVGKLYTELVNLYFELEENKEMMDILKKEYRISINKIQKCIYQFLKRIGRILIKVNNDKAKIWRK